MTDHFEHRPGKSARAVWVTPDHRATFEMSSSGRNPASPVSLTPDGRGDRPHPMLGGVRPDE